MRSLFVVPVFVLLIVGIAPTQAPGEYVLGRIGCTQACESQNSNVTWLSRSTSLNEYAYAVRSSAPRTVVAFSIFVESIGGAPTRIRAAIYKSADQASPDPSPVANALIDVAGRLDWYTAVLDVPVSVPSNTLFFVTAETGQVRPPDAGPTGATPVGSTFWRRPPLGGTPWSQSILIDSPIYRVHCLGSSGGVTTLRNSGLPVANASLALEVSGAPGGGLVVFGLGFSARVWESLLLPMDLAGVGAPGCFARCSIELTSGSVADSLGNASATFAIPSQPGILGGQFFNQGVVLDPSANSLGLVTSNLGTAKIGG